MSGGENSSHCATLGGEFLPVLPSIPYLRVRTNRGKLNGDPFSLPLNCLRHL